VSTLGDISNSAKQANVIVSAIVRTYAGRELSYPPRPGSCCMTITSNFTTRMALHYVFACFSDTAIKIMSRERLPLLYQWFIC
jgi:hypothetical protein